MVAVQFSLSGCSSDREAEWVGHTVVTNKAEGEKALQLIVFHISFLSKHN